MKSMGDVGSMHIGQLTCSSARKCLKTQHMWNACPHENRVVDATRSNGGQSRHSMRLVCGRHRSRRQSVMHRGSDDISCDLVSSPFKEAQQNAQPWCTKTAYCKKMAARCNTRWQDAGKAPPRPLKLTKDEVRDTEILYRMLDTQRRDHARVIAQVAAEVRRAAPSYWAHNDAAIRHWRLAQLGLPDESMGRIAVFLWSFFAMQEPREHLNFLWPGGILEDLFDPAHGIRRFSVTRRVA